MKKLEIINKIRGKVLGNIKNKLWFKNYQYKSQDKTEEKVSFSFVLSIIYFGIFGILGDLFLFQKIEQINYSTVLMILFAILGCGVLTSFSFFKLDNKIKKEEIDDFIKNSESGSNKLMVDLLNENNISSNFKQLARFIKNQPLEKKEIENFNQMIKSFNKDELNNVFFNEKLNNMIKEKGCIDYDYIIYALNLLEEKLKNKNDEQNIDTIKNDLYKEKNLNTSISPKNNVENVVSI